MARWIICFLLVIRWLISQGLPFACAPILSVAGWHLGAMIANCPPIVGLASARCLRQLPARLSRLLYISRPRVLRGERQVRFEGLETELGKKPVRTARAGFFVAHTAQAVRFQSR